MKIVTNKVRFFDTLITEKGDNLFEIKINFQQYVLFNGTRKQLGSLQKH